MADAAEHRGDPPVRPPERILDTGEGAWPAGRHRRLVQQLAHEVAAAVVEPRDLVRMVHGVLGDVLSGEPDAGAGGHGAVRELTQGPRSAPRVKELHGSHMLRARLLG